MWGQKRGQNPQPSEQEGRGPSSNPSGLKPPSLCRVGPYLYSHLFGSLLGSTCGSKIAGETDSAYDQSGRKTLPSDEFCLRILLFDWVWGSLDVTV